MLVDCMSPRQTHGIALERPTTSPLFSKIRPWFISSRLPSSTYCSCQTRYSGNPAASCSTVSPFHGRFCRCAATITHSSRSGCHLSSQVIVSNQSVKSWERRHPACRQRRRRGAPLLRSCLQAGCLRSQGQRICGVIRVSPSASYMNAAGSGSGVSVVLIRASRSSELVRNSS